MAQCHPNASPTTSRDRWKAVRKSSARSSEIISSSICNLGLKISIVIPAFNEERLIADTLQHIKAAAEVFRDRGWDTEIIVCDNNSKDKTAELARAAGAKVVFEPINQIARARNRGAAE